MTKEYLGDGVYVSYNRFGLILTTPEGATFGSNKIIIEPDVWDALQAYVKRQSPEWTRPVAEAEEDDDPF